MRLQPRTWSLLGVSGSAGWWAHGSYLTISHITADVDPEEAAAAQAAGQRSGVTYVPRSRGEVAAFFAGLDLVDPGVVPLLAWRPDGGTPQDPLAVRSYAAMGRKASAGAGPALR